MKIVNDALRAEYGGPGICEYCRMEVGRRHCHHVFTKGSGQVDVPCNLMSLCGTFSGGRDCHASFHNGNIARGELLAVVSEREGMTADEIEDQVQRLRRAPKENVACWACQGNGKIRLPISGLELKNDASPCDFCGGSGMLDHHGEPYQEKPR